MDYVKDFGAYLKELRLSRGLTIKALSDLSEVSMAYLSQMENGKRGIPSKEILEKLSIHLVVDYEQLLESAGYSRFRDIRNNLVHQGLNEFIEQFDINDFIENTFTYYIEVLRGLLTDERIPYENKQELMTMLHSYSSFDHINNEIDFESFKAKVLQKLNPKDQLFYLLSLIDFMQNSYCNWYKPNKISEYLHHNSILMDPSFMNKKSNINRDKYEDQNRISPRLRFRVLRRDQSTCQICGAKAPETKIVVDYINSYSLEVEENIDHLHAICIDCHMGMKEEFLHLKTV